MLELFDPLQKVLNFGNCKSPQFVENGLGKIGTTGFMIGLVGGVHFGVGVTLYVVKTAIITEKNGSILSAMVYPRAGNLYSSQSSLFHHYFTSDNVVHVHEPPVLFPLHGVLHYRRAPTQGALI